MQISPEKRLSSWDIHRSFKIRSKIKVRFLDGFRYSAATDRDKGLKFWETQGNQFSSMSLKFQLFTWKTGLVTWEGVQEMKLNLGIWHKVLFSESTKTWIFRSTPILFKFSGKFRLAMLITRSSYAVKNIQRFNSYDHFTNSRSENNMESSGTQCGQTLC